jgi:hypothetical protein
MDGEYIEEVRLDENGEEYTVVFRNTDEAVLQELDRVRQELEDIGLEPPLTIDDVLGPRA